MADMVEERESGIIALNKNEDRYLGFKISSSGRPDVAAIKKERSRSVGYIVRGGKIIEWIGDGFYESQGRYLLGPYFDGVSLLAILEQRRGKERLKVLLRLATALVSLKQHDHLPEKIVASSIYVLDDGGMLFLPDEIATRLCACVSAEARRKGCTELNHPEYRGEAGLSFGIAVATYQALAGDHPFAPDAEIADEELRNRMRNGDYIPAYLCLASIDGELARRIDSALTADETVLILEEWPALLRSLIDGEDSGGVSSTEEEQRRREAQRLGLRKNRRRTVESFFRGYRVHLAVAVVIVAITGSIAGTMISNALEPPVTVGMSPAEVVGLFYGSINRFDHMAIEDALAPGVGEGFVREATNLFVISRMRQGYEQRGESLSRRG